MATEKPRYTVSVDDDLFKKIEAFRFENHFQTRSSATITLIEKGLLALKHEEKKPTAPEGMRPVTDSALKLVDRIMNLSPQNIERTLDYLEFLENRSNAQEP